MRFGEDQWKSSRKEIKNYRDKFVAHHDPERFKSVPNVPFLGIALESSYMYYDHVAKGVPELHGVDLRTYCEGFSEQNQKVAQRALSATADMHESTF
jgi:hypothetical protein